jgi:N-methylhydantoinase A
MREYERFSTACANAYIQPLMARYLDNLRRDLAAGGFDCPLFLMLSGGGLATVATAIRFPVRLVESGPAGGAIFSSHLARQCGLDRVLSFDMGGTTAKICLIDDARPQTSRSFEVARIYRFKKGSGLPLRIPVIEMVEIGAGGGSIARLDVTLSSEVSPEMREYERFSTACANAYVQPLMSRYLANLERGLAAAAIARTIGERLQLSAELAALGVSEMVDENMANAARVHAIESGKDVRARTLIAFGGAAPLHAARVAEKLGISRILVPANAGVGSAVGFLRAPVAYEIVRSQVQRLGSFQPAAVNRLLQEMRAEAEAIVRLGAGDVPLAEHRSAFMRYRGQGHEIAVPVPARSYRAEDAEELLTAFEAAYRALYSRVISGVEVEILSWVTVVSAAAADFAEAARGETPHVPAPKSRRRVFDPATGEAIEVPIYWRSDLSPGARIAGPAIIAEDETSTVVSRLFDARIDGLGYIHLRRR